MRILWVPWVVLTTRNERNTLGLERFLALSLKYNNDLEKLTFTKSQTVGWEREIVDYREKNYGKAAYLLAVFCNCHRW